MFGNALWGNQFLTYDNSWSTFMPLGYQRTIAPRKILDAMGYLERETAAISRRTGNAHGYARYKLLYYEVRQPGFGWELLSSFTCFIPNFFGMPFNRLRTDLELQLEIVDAQGNILSTYRSAQSALAWSAPYWGLLVARCSSESVHLGPSIGDDGYKRTNSAGSEYFRNPIVGGWTIAAICFGRIPALNRWCSIILKQNME